MGLTVAESVRVLDISRSGVLLHTSSPPDVGARARLRLSVAGEPLAAHVEVRRVSAVLGGYRVGARFVEMTPVHRRLIAQVMGR
jgi:hypothetical protein